MRFWIRLLLGTVALIVIAAYAEFVLDFRGPRSQLRSEDAVAAITSTSYGERDAELDKARARYGGRVRAHDQVPGGTVNGKWTITVDGNVIKEGRIIVKLAGMYGLFAVASGDAIEGIFPFSIVPGRAALSATTSVEALRDRFKTLPVRFLAFADADTSIDSSSPLGLPNWDLVR